MLSNTHHHHEENDDELEDIETLRRIAMDSINNKKSKEEMQQIQLRSSYQSQPSSDSIYGIAYQNTTPSFPPVQHPRMPHNNYMAPRYMSQQNLMSYQQFAPPYHPRANQPLMHQDFSTPMPHLNPQFMPQPPQLFPNDYQPAVSMDYVPTAAIRLSPRSLEFVESNKKALMNANSKKRSKSPNGRRRYSRGSRSRSRSPTRNIHRPYKRYRSKSPSNNFNYKNRKGALEKERGVNSPNRYAKKAGRDNNTRNSNGTKFDRIRSESDKDDDESVQSSQKSTQSEKKLNESIDEASESVKSVSPVPEEKVTVKKESPEKQKPEIKVAKTQDEIENELLASTDDEAEELDIELEVGADELNFLDMDDSESENEGRFKDKPSSNIKKETEKFSGGKKSTLYAAKNHSNRSKLYDKSSRDDKYKRHGGSRKNSPEYPRRGSPERRKSPKFAGKDEENRKSLFKSTFKSIEASEKRDELPSKRSEKQAASIRSTVIKAESNSKTSSVKSVISSSDETSSSRKRKILERLGEYVGVKTKSSEVSSKSVVSSKQVVRRNSRFKRIERQVVMKFNAISN